MVVFAQDLALDLEGLAVHLERLVEVPFSSQNQSDAVEYPQLRQGEHRRVGCGKF